MTQFIGVEWQLCVRALTFILMAVINEPLELVKSGTLKTKFLKGKLLYPKRTAK
jgi:hypothetical protein